jgi:hypothetical protein
MIDLSKRHFKLWHYSVSHSTLIIRSERQYDDVEYSIIYEPNCTIDLEFSGVEFISLPEKINVYNLRKENGVYRFNDNKDHFVKASSCIVGLSQFEGQDRLSDFSLKYDEIILSI